MEVYYFGDLIADMPVDLTSIKLEKVIECTNGAMLPYENIEFQTSIKSLFDDVIKDSNLSWRIPDYQKSKIYLYITNNEIYLSVEVFPKYLSIDEKRAMLKTASHEEMSDGWSEYLRLMSMFDDIDEILNSSYPIGEMGVYSLEMTNKEKKMILFLYKNKCI